MKKIACVGILVADVIVEPVSEYPAPGALMHVNSISLHNGGNAMTAAINLSKMGVESRIVGKVGEDFFGEFLKTKLAAAGVDTRALASDSSAQTSASVALISAGGERSFLHVVGANATFCYDDIDFSVIDECDAVFVTGTYLLNKFDGEDTVKFLKKCQEMGKTTFLDVCYDASGRWGEVLFPAMPYMDFFMPSIDEAVMIAGETDPDKIADVFFAHGVKNVVIKLGGKGAYIRLAGEDKGTVYPCVKGIKAVDTTGAGDSFSSGFLAAFARDMEPHACMKIANAAGGLSVTQKGATTWAKSFDEVENLAKTGVYGG